MIQIILLLLNKTSSIVWQFIWVCDITSYIFESDSSTVLYYETLCQSISHQAWASSKVPRASFPWAWGVPCAGGAAGSCAASPLSSSGSPSPLSAFLCGYPTRQKNMHHGDINVQGLIKPLKATIIQKCMSFRRIYILHPERDARLLRLQWHWL